MQNDSYIVLLPFTGDKKAEGNVFFRDDNEKGRHWLLNFVCKIAFV